nr:hypothetical protein [Lactiplantibacillus daoliensis]
MIILIIIGLIFAAVTIGLGYWSYILGKQQKTNFTGSIIPLGYFIVRAIFAVTMGDGTRELLTSLVGSLVIALIYIWLFSWGKQRTH